jgi:hypothetical protein
LEIFLKVLDETGVQTASGRVGKVRKFNWSKNCKQKGPKPNPGWKMGRVMGHGSGMEHGAGYLNRFLKKEVINMVLIIHVKLVGF